MGARRIGQRIRRGARRLVSRRAPHRVAARFAALGAALSIAAADDELIEFLGSVGDTDDGEDWLDFLHHTDIDQVAKRGAKPPTRGR